MLAQKICAVFLWDFWYGHLKVMVTSHLAKWGGASRCTRNAVKQTDLLFIFSSQKLSMQHIKNRHLPWNVQILSELIGLLRSRFCFRKRFNSRNAIASISFYREMFFYNQCYSKTLPHEESRTAGTLVGLLSTKLGPMCPPAIKPIYWHKVVEKESAALIAGAKKGV